MTKSNCEGGESYSSLVLCCHGLGALCPSQAPSERVLENKVQLQTHCAQSQLVCLAREKPSNQSLLSFRWTLAQLLTGSGQGVVRETSLRIGERRNEAMLAFTCGRQRCSHSWFQSPGTDRDQVGDNASQSPGKEGVTTRTTGMQLRSQELQSQRTAVKGCHWLSKGKIILKQPVPKSLREEKLTDTDLIPPQQPQSLQISPKDAGSWQ